MSIDPRFIIDLKGRSHPLFAGVLDLATRSGLKVVDTDLVQIPGDDNGHVAIAKATVSFEDGRIFSAYGDASPRNVARHLIEATIRMAETRAVGRALRNACNVGQALAEEMPEEDDAPAAAAPRAQTQPKPAGNGNGTPACEECGVVLTPGQATFSRQKFGKLLCAEHQKAAAKV